MKDWKELPIVKPLLALFKSRKFTLALAVIAASFIVLKVPELAPYKELIIAMFLVVFGILAGTITAEDVAKINAGAPVTIDEALTQLKQEVKTELLMFARQYLESK